MERSGRCPFAPPPEVMELAAAAPMSRVRIWNGETPWLITGYEEARALFADSRVSVDDRKSGFPHWNEHMLATVDKRPRSVFTADAEEHTFYRRMLSKPFTFKRVEGLRPAIQRVELDQHRAGGVVAMRGDEGGDVIKAQAGQVGLDPEFGGEAGHACCAAGASPRAPGVFVPRKRGRLISIFEIEAHL